MIKINKRVLSLLLALVMIFGTFTSVFAAKPAEDFDLIHKTDAEKNTTMLEFMDNVKVFDMVVKDFENYMISYGGEEYSVVEVDKYTKQGLTLVEAIEKIKEARLAAAEAAVKKAEETKKQADVDAARELVDALIESDAKDGLTARLDAVQAEIDAAEALEAIKADIEELPEANEINFDNKDEVKEKIDAINKAIAEAGLNDVEIENIHKLRQAEDKIKELEKEKAAIEAAIGELPALEDITLEHKDQVEAISKRIAEAGLNDVDIKDIHKLRQAEDKIAELEAEAEAAKQAIIVAAKEATEKEITTVEEAEAIIKAKEDFDGLSTEDKVASDVDIPALNQKVAEAKKFIADKEAEAEQLAAAKEAYEAALTAAAEAEVNVDAHKVTDVETATKADFEEATNKINEAVAAAKKAAEEEAAALAAAKEAYEAAVTAAADAQVDVDAHKVTDVETATKKELVEATEAINKAVKDAKQKAQDIADVIAAIDELPTVETITENNFKEVAEQVNAVEKLMSDKSIGHNETKVTNIDKLIAVENKVNELKNTKLTEVKEAVDPLVEKNGKNEGITKKEFDEAMAKVDELPEGQEKDEQKAALEALIAQTAPADAKKEMGFKTEIESLYVMSTAILKPGSTSQAVTPLAEFAEKYKEATGLDIDTRKIHLFNSTLRVEDGLVNPESWDQIKNKENSLINKPYRITILSGEEKTSKIAKIEIFRDGTINVIEP